MKVNTLDEEFSTPVLDLKLIHEDGSLEFITLRIFTQTDDRVEVFSSRYGNEFIFDRNNYVSYIKAGKPRCFARTTLRTVDEKLVWGLTLIDLKYLHRESFLSSIEERIESIFRFEMLTYLASRYACQPDKTFDLDATFPYIRNTLRIEREEFEKFVNFMKE